MGTPRYNSQAALSGSPAAGTWAPDLHKTLLFKLLDVSFMSAWACSRQMLCSISN